MTYIPAFKSRPRNHPLSPYFQQVICGFEASTTPAAIPQKSTKRRTNNAHVTVECGADVWGRS
jgi:hypothetical protein